MKMEILYYKISQKICSLQRLIKWRQSNEVLKKTNEGKLVFIIDNPYRIEFYVISLISTSDFFLFLINHIFSNNRLLHNLEINFIIFNTIIRA